MNIYLVTAPAGFLEQVLPAWTSNGICTERLGEGGHGEWNKRRNRLCFLPTLWILAKNVLVLLTCMGNGNTCLWCVVGFAVVGFLFVWFCLF